MLADSIKAVKAAETEAAQIITDAKAKAEQITQQASEEAAAVLSDSEKRARIAEKELLELASQKAENYKKQVIKQTEEEAAKLRNAARAAADKAIAAVIDEIV